ncbi:hypothetical protein ACFV1F_34945 [Streptomyces sp. NPDC059590]|uniref:hypothetical protein n=1 Tax=unclassified Streptomyces TaxID=2593676 RepID=UPI00368B1FC9
MAGGGQAKDLFGGVEGPLAGSEVAKARVCLGLHGGYPVAGWQQTMDDALNS